MWGAVENTRKRAMQLAACKEEVPAGLGHPPLVLRLRPDLYIGGACRAFVGLCRDTSLGTGSRRL